MEKQTKSLISIRDGLWAIQIGYGIAYTDAVKAGEPIPNRVSWIVKWCSANMPYLTPDFANHARKIIANYSANTKILVGTDTVQVNAAEFIIDSLFALDQSVEVLPKYAIPIPREWVEYVKQKNAQTLSLLVSKNGRTVLRA